MKTPLSENDVQIPSLLLEHWNLRVTGIAFIPMGDSAYSYKIEVHPQSTYYLKIVDQRTAVGRRTAAHMEFSLPFQRLVAGNQFPGIAAPQPQTTIQGTLYAVHDSWLLALYTFIPGDTLADAYPMSPDLIKQIGQALGALHTVQLPESLCQWPPQDNLTAPFDDDLLADLASLAHISTRDAFYLQRLRELIWPRREEIRAFLAHSQEYEAKARRTEVPLVACHGDAWGGNMILTPAGQLVLLDWESSVIAPPERDAFLYGADFAAFDAGYHLIHKEPMRWHANWLAFYGYRIQLRNLAQWLHNLLHENLDEAQRENDLAMLGFHCLDRLKGVERTASELVAFLT